MIFEEFLVGLALFPHIIMLPLKVSNSRMKKKKNKHLHQFQKKKKKKRLEDYCLCRFNIT